MASPEQKESKDKGDRKDDNPSQKQDTSLGIDLISLATSFGQIFGTHLLAYCLGYYEFSVSWLFFTVFVFIWKEKNRRDKDHQRAALTAISTHEQDTIVSRLQDLPSWVFFPDVERAEWLNKIIRQLWPYIGDYVKDFIVEHIEPSVRENLRQTLKTSSFRFEKIDLGDVPVRIGGIKVYRENVSRKEILMDLDIYYAGDCFFQVGVSNFKAGLKDIQLRGTIRVVMKPLTKQIPMVGGLQIFFLNNPTLDFNLTNIANAFDIPGLADLIRTAIIDQIANMMVLPNKFPVKLMEDVSNMSLRFPQPVGVLRINVIEARDLMKKDLGILGKSDPYAVVTVGAQEFRTHIIDKTVNPEWNYYCEVSIEALIGQSVAFALFDYDQGSDDDCLGRCSYDIQSIATKGEIDTWIQLEDAKTGRVHLKLTWLSLSKNVTHLYETLRSAQALKEDLSAALLNIYVDSAKHLPDAGKAAPEPSPFVRMTLLTQRRQTNPCYKTNDPVWEQGFSFLVHNPEHQEILIEVVDVKTDKVLGTLNFPIRRLLTECSLELHRPFPLKSGGTNAEIVLLFQLRVFRNEPLSPERLEGETPVREVKPEPPVPAPVHADISPKETGKADPPPTPKTSVKECAPPAASTSETNEPEPETPRHGPSKQEDLFDNFVTEPGSLQESYSGAAESTLRKRMVQGQNSSESSAALRGRIQLTLRYSLQRQRLVVVVHKVSGLPNILSGNEVIDPYVKLYLLPDHSSTKRKTGIVKNTCDPVYDETFEYNIPPQDVASRTLSVEVCTRSSSSVFSKSLVVGQVQIDLSQENLTNAVTEWYDLESEKENSTSHD